MKDPFYTSFFRDFYYLLLDESNCKSINKTPTQKYLEVIAK